MDNRDIIQVGPIITVVRDSMLRKYRKAAKDLDGVVIKVAARAGERRSVKDGESSTVPKGYSEVHIYRSSAEDLGEFWRRVDKLR